MLKTMTLEKAAIIISLTALGMFAAMLITVNSIDSRTSAAADLRDRSFQMADNMDYMANPGLRDLDRQAGRAERNGY